MDGGDFVGEERRRRVNLKPLLCYSSEMISLNSNEKREEGWEEK